MPETIEITKIVRDGGTQSRAGYNPNVVNEYADLMREGAHFPPIEVVFDGSAYYLYDGFHRVTAAENIGLTSIEAHIVQGTLEDAQWQSYRANATNGLHRSSEDKRRAVIAALKHRFGAGKSDSQLARHIGVDHKTVGHYRKELEGTGEIPKSDERTGADGRTINTSSIGRQRPADFRPENEWRNQFPKETLVFNMRNDRIGKVRGYLLAEKQVVVFDLKLDDKQTFSWSYTNLRAATQDEVKAYLKPALQEGDTVRTRAGHIVRIVKLERRFAYVEGDSRGHFPETLTKVDPLPVAEDHMTTEQAAGDAQLAGQVIADDEDGELNNGTLDDYREQDEQAPVSAASMLAPWRVQAFPTMAVITDAEGELVCRIYHQASRSDHWSEMAVAEYIVGLVNQAQLESAE